MSESESRPYEILARYIAASVTAYKEGITLNYALKRDADIPLGPAWYDLAEKALRVGTDFY